MLKENGMGVEFVCRKHEGNLIDRVRSSGFNVHELEVFEKTKADNKLAHSHWLGATQEQDADDCIKILKSEKLDWLIVDHYALDEQWEKILKSYCKKIMVIDDLADRKHRCDILLDQTFGRQQESYSTLSSKDCKLLLGSQYALLRPEFSKWRPYSLKRRGKQEFKQLLISMGGVDVDDFTGRILDEIKTCTLPHDVNIIVVMGEHSPYFESVKSKIEMFPYKTKIKANAGNMAEIMANTDIAIGASGSTTWERCCLGVPTIQLVTAYNQEYIARKLDEIDAIKLVDIDNLSKNLESYQYWMKEVSKNAKNITNGNGAKAVVEYLL